MEVTDESPEELERFYKSMLQWKSRHKALYPGLEVKKQASHVYVSIEPPEQLAS